MIWTTTPWTIPGNRALAYGADIAYALVEVAEVARGQPGQGRARSWCWPRSWSAPSPRPAKFTPKVAGRARGRATSTALVAAHPLRGQGYDFDVPLLPGDFVTADAGTGFVHIAPGHGADDFELGVANGVEVPDTVAEDGSYYPHVPLFAGKKVYTRARRARRRQPRRHRRADEAGKLLARGRSATAIRIPGAPRRR